MSNAPNAITFTETPFNESGILKRLSSPVFFSFFERLNLFLPFPFLLICLSEAFLAYPISEKSQIFSSFITSTIFLNNIHTYFTLAFFSFIPEFGEWINHHKANRFFWARPLLVFLSIFALYLLLYWKFIPEYLMIPFLFITVLPAIHHGVRQIQGISLLYNRNIEQTDLSPEVKQKIRKSEKWERRFFHTFLFFYCTYLVLLTFGIDRLLSSNFSLNTIREFAFLMYVSSIFGIFYVNFWTCRELALNKFVYLLRLLLFMVVPFSYSAAFGLAAIHGIEYLGILNLISRKSKANDSQRNRFYQGTIIFSVLGLILLLARRNDGLALFFFDSYDSLPRWIHIMAALSLGFTFLHYYLDRILFQMSRAENRKFILPLILQSDGVRSPHIYPKNQQ